jgi:hypothetical protein
MQHNTFRQEQIMTALTASYTTKTNTGLGNKIGVALRKMFVRFVLAHEAQAALLMSDRNLLGATELNRMADRFEAAQPNLAAELRFIASRG